MIFLREAKNKLTFTLQLQTRIILLIQLWLDWLRENSQFPSQYLKLGKKKRDSTNQLRDVTERISFVMRKWTTLYLYRTIHRKVHTQVLNYHSSNMALLINVARCWCIILAFAGHHTVRTLTVKKLHVHFFGCGQIVSYPSVRSIQLNEWWCKNRIKESAFLFPCKKYFALVFSSSTTSVWFCLSLYFLVENNLPENRIGLLYQKRSWKIGLRSFASARLRTHKLLGQRNFYLFLLCSSFFCSLMQTNKNKINMRAHNQLF